MNNNDLEFMHTAIEKAKESKNKRGKVPIYVGAVITRNEEVLAKASRGELETGVHAEVTAFERLKNKKLEGATLYTTLEPCIIGSHGTEKYRWPCARWIVERRIKKVWIGDLDLNPNICGRGVAYLEDHGITIDYFPSNLRGEIRELNKEFIKKQKRRPTVLLANRSDEKNMIWQFLERLQLQGERYYGSRLLWFCGPAGIGKSELIAWLRVVAEERKIMKAARSLVLNGNPAIIYFRQLANIKSDDIEMVRREGGSPEDFVCTAVANDLSADTQPKILILDSDSSFNDLGGLSNLVGRLLSKLEHAPYVGIVVTTRNPPGNINTHTIRPLNLNDVEEMCKLNKWQIKQGVLEELYNKSNGNPLLVILLYACYVTAGKLPGSTNIKEILQDFLSHLNPIGEKLFKRLAVALSAPFENEEKMIDRDILLATIPLEEKARCEKALKELNEMGIVHIDPHLRMHDEIIGQIKRLLPEDEAKQQHYDLAQILKDKDPLGALWHLMKSGKANEAIELLELAAKSSREQLQISRFIQTFSAVGHWFEELTRLEVREEIKTNYLFNMGYIFQKIADIEAKAENCKKVIKFYENALKVYTLERFPMDYAATQNNLGAAYNTLAEVESKAENCKKAIKAFEEALEVRTFERFPMDYTATQNNLGAAYQTLAEVDAKAENCRKALKAYGEALEVHTSDRFPMQYAVTLNNLGNPVLKDLNIETLRMQYAATLNNLGNTFLTLAEVESKAENCKMAIKAYEKAIKVRTLDRFPMDYAMTQNNLGNAYRTLAKVEAKAKNCKKAIKAFEEAIKVYTLDRFPMQYAATQNNLGIAYGILADVESKAENCKKAIKAYEKALKVYTPDRFPMDYAMTQNNLGNAYQTLAEVESKAKNCKKAIRSYEEALKVRTLERFPMDYAMTQNNLGNAYRTLAEVESKVKNCKDAIKACEEALKVRTLERFPMQYATTQNSLGNAYQTLAKVESKAKNCKRAIEAYGEALKFYTLESFPQDYAMTKNNLGNAYGTIAEVEDKSENCKNAIKAYGEALKVFTKEEYPEIYPSVELSLRKVLDFCEGE